MSFPRQAVTRNSVNEIFRKPQRGHAQHVLDPLHAVAHDLYATIPQHARDDTGNLTGRDVQLSLMCNLAAVIAYQTVTLIK